MKIALTGSMGCGKSAALNAFKIAGARTLDADKLAHFVLEKDSEVITKVKKLLGEKVYNENGEPNRSKIAKIVFSSPEKLESLEKIIHPAIEKIWNAESEDKDGDKKIVVVEVPLLFEKKLEKNFDICVTILCGENLRLKRLAERGLSPEEISERDAFQLPPAEKAKLADIVLFNEGDLEFLNRQAAYVLSRLK